jgi:hypothetical protein
MATRAHAFLKNKDRAIQRRGAVFAAGCRAFDFCVGQVGQFVFNRFIPKNRLAADQDTVLVPIQNDLNPSYESAKRTKPKTASAKGKDQAEPDAFAARAHQKDTGADKGQNENDQRDTDEPGRIGDNQLVRGVSGHFHGGTLAPFQHPVPVCFITVLREIRLKRAGSGQRRP